MKQLLKLSITFLLAIALVQGAFAQSNEGEPERELTLEEQVAKLREEVNNLKKFNFKVSGEAKTGIYWRESQEDGREKNEHIGLHNMDDAGGESSQGRFRLNMEYESQSGFGFKARIQWQNFGTDPVPEAWPYAFGYGNFFNNQLTVAVGKLGGSPWGTGGPELWKDLENVDKSLGMRVEYKPGWVPENVGKFNIGFVLNYFNSDRDQGWDADVPVTLKYLLEESMFGLSYTHKYANFRFAYKLDSEFDAKTAIGKTAGGTGEDEIVYRVEETILRTMVPGLKFWALGHLYGISALHEEIKNFINYAFIEYEPEEFKSLPDWTSKRPFTAQLRLGYNYIENRSELHIKPSFYWNFFNKLISTGVSFWYGQDFGVKYTEGSPFSFIELDPKIQINFSSSYIAFVYVWRREYFHENLAHVDPVTGFEYEPIKQTQKMNLRFCIYY